MRIGYFGTSVFAVPALRKLSSDIVVVVSQPDRPTGRGMKLTPSPVKQVAEELGLRVETPPKCRDEHFIDSVERLDLDFLLVAAYGQILPVRLLQAAKQGAINLHGSILPRYRGAAPIQRAIQDGEKETGVTLMQMDKGMDTGDMIAISRTPIRPDETYGELQDRLALVAADLASDWAIRIASGDYPREVQSNDEATHAAKVGKPEAELLWNGSAETEYNRFRAFTPSPGAYVRTSEGVLKLKTVRFHTSSGSVPPGEVVATSPHLQIAWSDGVIELVQVQPEGKPSVSGRDWANGQRLRTGMNIRPE